MTLTNCSTKAIDFHSSWAKVDDVVDLVKHLMSDVNDTGDDTLVFRHMRALLFTARSVVILLASALCGPPMPRTSNPPNKLCDFRTADHVAVRLRGGTSFVCQAFPQ